jgi:hypothetical protein
LQTVSVLEMLLFLSSPLTSRFKDRSRIFTLGPDIWAIIIARLDENCDEPRVVIKLLQLIKTLISSSSSSQNRDLFAEASGPNLLTVVQKMNKSHAVIQELVAELLSLF